MYMTELRSFFSIWNVGCGNNTVGLGPRRLYDWAHEPPVAINADSSIACFREQTRIRE